MPKQVNEYYRYRRLYGPEIRRYPLFRRIVEQDRQNLLKDLPKDCDRCIAYNTFEHDHEDLEGVLVINYFESEDDLMAYKAVQAKDDKIYLDYVQRKKEQRMLNKFNYSR